jgi:hypothetical protein
MINKLQRLAVLAGVIFGNDIIQLELIKLSSAYRIMQEAAIIKSYTESSCYSWMQNGLCQQLQGIIGNDKR